MRGVGGRAAQGDWGAGVWSLGTHPQPWHQERYIRGPEGDADTAVRMTITSFSGASLLFPLPHRPSMEASLACTSSMKAVK